MVLVKKWDLFPPFYFWQNREEKSLWPYSRKEKRPFLDYNNKKEKTSKNWPFSTGVSPWFWSKNGILSTFLFLAK